MSKILKSLNKLNERLNKIIKFSTSTGEKDASDIAVNNELLSEIWVDFRKLSPNIPDDDECTAIEDNIEENYKSVKSALMKLEIKSITTDTKQDFHNPLLKELVNQQRSFIEQCAHLANTSHNSETKTTADIKLPKLPLTTFDGVSYMDWPAYKDFFVTTIHKNNKLSNIQKYQYLIQSVKGKALELINGLTLSNEAYDEAWEKLCARYNKPDKIAFSYIESLLNQPATTRSSATEVRRICESADETIRGLRALGENAESRDIWLIYLLLNKLDADSRLLWSREAVGNDMPKLTKFLEFLRNRADELEGAQFSTKANSRPNKIIHLHSSTIPQCIKCSQPHLLFKCPDFRQLSSFSRYEFVYQNNLCHNCLKSGHSTTSCLSKYVCRLCSRRHHTLLHYQRPSNQNAVQTKSYHIQPEQHNAYDQSFCDSGYYPNNQLQQDNALKQSQGTHNQAVPDSSSDIQHASTQNCNNQQAYITQQQFNQQSHIIQQPIFNQPSPLHINQHPTFNQQTNMNTQQISNQQPNLSAISNKNSTFLVTSAQGSIRDTVQSILPTALVNVRDKFGNQTKCRVLLDSGSQASFVTEECVNRLGINRVNARVPVTGLASVKAGTTNGLVTLELSSLYNHKSISIKALILPKLTSMIPSQTFEFRKWTAGPISQPNADTLHSVNITTLLSNLEINVDRILQKFWTSEELIEIQPYTPNEKQCEQHYTNTTCKDESGRLIVQIPFKANSPPLGNSLKSAVSRLYSMERKFARDEKLRDDYVQFMVEYERLGHMIPIPSNEIYIPDENVFYLPHHAVRKESSTTTKLRVVFDASCKTTSGVSLNDTMLVGPTIQNTLTNILLRFRTHAIVFTADIEKMFRQVRVHKKHYDFQRIVWRTSPLQPINHYRLVTVTYGTASASFLATRSLQQLAIEHENQYPYAAQIIKDDFYMDDLMSGADNLEDAQRIRTEIDKILKSGGMQLRKWSSNSPLLLRDLPEQAKEVITRNIDDDPTYIKLLGIQWNPTQYTFTFKIHLEPIEIYSKRKMLSEASRVFDPLGWVAPVTIYVKILFQQLWIKNLSWDDPLPEEISFKWSKIREQYPCLENLQIPRNVCNHKSQVDLIGFSDASEQAFAAVIYIRYVTENGSVICRLLTSKTRVAPIKTISLPRLELNAALLLTRLMKNVQTALNIQQLKLRAFTDSMIVLGWLEALPRSWKTFVSNRVSEIIDFLPRHYWGHVNTKENPADLATRGIYPKEIISLDLWWNGPTWLQTDESEWPINRVLMNNEHKGMIEIRKEKRNIHSVFTISTSKGQLDFFETLISKYSFWSKLINVTTYCIKFIKKLRRVPNLSKYVTCQELKDAEQLFIKYTQQKYFAVEINSLVSKCPVPTKSQLADLDPFLDDDNLLRVGGRLRHSQLPFTTKHPVILPKACKYTEILINYYHVKYLHANIHLLVSILRQKYWIMNCKNIAKTIIHKCLVCFRYKRHNPSQLMGDLPAPRVQSFRPFQHCGVDFAGPLNIKLRKGRCNQTTKGYIALFICLSTKAVHLDVATDLSSKEFLSVLRRFTGRRGIPSVLYSDNATNFVGCNKLLKELFSKPNIEEIIKHLHQDGISWQFIPPLSPHFGGIWESNIKSVKYYLKRAIGDILLTYDELLTLLIQVEALLNSRPLTTNTTDELNPLTPAHFLIGQPLTLIPEQNLLDVKMSLMDRWQLLQRSVQQFWNHWHKNYLTCLNQRPKWRFRSPNLSEGEIVIITDRNSSPGKWLLGKIIKLHPGQDSLVRVATVKTKSGEFKRNVTKLCRLPIDV